MKLAKIRNNETQSESLVAITSDDKPAISQELQNKWQKIVDLCAKIIGVPSGLITKLHEHELEIFLTSKNKENIFEQNVKLELGLGWYCETTTGTRNELVVPNALTMDKWKDNPSVPFNMISYLGIPILWPDGEVFGTFCMLDNKENEYSVLYKDLLVSLREIIQNDLNAVLQFHKAQQDIFEKESQLKEVHHRVKNHFALLISTLNLQSLFNTGEQSIESVLADVQSRITAISMIHDKLYHSMNLEQVSLGEYLSELGKHLIDHLSERPITLSWTSDEISAGAKISVPCGLILNELITNSLKYAFAKISSPLITLNIKKENDGIILTYKDNGPGLPDDFDENTSSSLGINLLKNSVLQLGGEHYFGNEKGFVFRMKFKI